MYDYADLEVPMFSRMFDRRCKGYEAVGYTVHVPASALPGWPLSVPLPVDPQWKTQHSSTVRRLVLDGVDPPLANLFVEASQEGTDRASELFLFRRLETLAETTGRFRLNVELSIPFDAALPAIAPMRASSKCGTSLLMASGAITVSASIPT